MSTYFPAFPRFTLAQLDAQIREIHGARARQYVCKFCGMPSHKDPSDQVPPPDYCHPEDHDVA